jgi:hypothetical protein
MTARRMIGADVAKVGRRAGTVVWAAVLAILPLVIYFIVAAIQHSSNPTSDRPAGGAHGFSIGLQILVFFFGPLSAMMVGVQAGLGDSAAGVFRELVVTGRSRLSLFASRIPGALLVALSILTVAFAIDVIGTIVFRSGAHDPSAGTILKSWGFLLLSDGVVCVVVVGLAAALDSRVASLISFIGCELILFPALVNDNGLGSFREVFLDSAVRHIDPAPLSNDRFHVPMTTGAVVLTFVLWTAIACALGAWRTWRLEA